tara:strand:- start:93 stop:521 length:429 start_codon:yes stop_codon:yes gene_type:complete
MIKVVGFLKFIFYLSILLLIIITLYPGSLLGLLLYGDLGIQPNLAENPYFTPIPSHLYTYASVLNHFIVYFYVSMLGLYLYLRSQNFQKIVYGLFFLSIFLEVLQFIVPRRAFEIYDISANFAGVLVAYCLLKIYKIWKNYE